MDRISICRAALIAVFLVASPVSSILAVPQKARGSVPVTDDESNIAGTWRGESLCVEKGTSCHDEIAVYRIATIPGRRGYLMVTGGKVVDGKEVVMGSGEWRYDSGTRTLTTENPQGVIALEFDGNTAEGTFTLPDKRVLRRITLKKAQTLSGEALVEALRQGGYVIVMRHASSPRQTPDKGTANADNLNLERQLDEGGRASATAMGIALRNLKIPVGEVFTSPTYRALETVRLAQLVNPKPSAELGDGGQSMQGVTDAQGAWLQKKVAQTPKGTNTMIVTHMPNIAGAFPALASGVADGEALVFAADGKGGAALVARVKIDEWPRMKGGQSPFPSKGGLSPLRPAYFFLFRDNRS